MSLWDNFRNVVDGVDEVATKGFEIAGSAVAGALENVPGGTQFFEAYGRAARGISREATRGISALPGGIPTLTPEEASQISPGQAAAANVGAVTGGLVRGSMRPGGAVELLARGAAAATGAEYDSVVASKKFNEQLEDKLPWFTEQFDIKDEEDRKKAFSESPAGKVLSGVGDTLFAWWADPGVILGKGVKVARSGGQIGPVRTMGITDRTIKTARDSFQISKEIDDHVLFRNSGGSLGRETSAGLAVERTLNKDAAEMVFDPLARRSNNKGLIAALLGESDDLATSALIVKAGIGNADAMDVLRARSASTADALERATKMSESAQASFNKPIGELTDADIWVRRPEDAVRLDQIVDDLTAKDQFLSRALELEYSTGTIRKIGSRSKALEKARTSFIAQRTATKLDPDRYITDDAIRAPGFVERVFQRNDYVRPVRVVAKAANWVEGKRPAGWIGLKGGLANDSIDELYAGLMNSPTLARNMGNVGYRRDVMNSFLQAATPTQRLQVITQLEREASRTIARRYMIDESIADQLYDSYYRSRNTASNYLKQRGYLVDTDGSIIKSPVLSSQLADGVPMMDFRVYEDLIRRHQNPLRQIAGSSRDVVQSVLEPLYTAWKASVLFRLGYTVRNTTEGNLRSAAAYSFLPAFADPWGSMRRFAANDSRRERLLRNYTQELFTGRNPKVLRAKIKTLRDTQDALEKQLDDLRVQADYIRLSEMPAATGVDTMRYTEYINASDQHGIRFDVGDIEEAIGSPTASLLPTKQRKRFLELNEIEQSGEILTGAALKEYRHLRGKASRTRLRELQATGKEIVVRRGDKFDVVKNVRQLTDEDLVPIIASRRGIPGKAIEEEIVTLEGRAKARVGPREAPEVYVVDRWKTSIETATRMGETVPGRVAREAGVRNPRPVGRYEYYLDEIDQDVALSNIADIAKIEEQLSELYTLLDQAAARRTVIGSRKRLGDEDVFSGTYGNIARANASADATIENTIMDMMSQYEIKRSGRTNSWGVVNPGDPQYYDELARVTNFQFKNDAIAERILRGESREDVIKWLRSPDARKYREDMEIGKLDVPAHVDRVDDMVTSYLPDPELRMRAAEGELSPIDFEAALSSYELGPIHGRLVEEVTSSGVFRKNWYRDGIRQMYRILGTAPEDLAVRHPFYRHVHRLEQTRLQQMYLDQGREITLDLKEKINKSAHQQALRETRRTLYTIERYSNPAMVLRWLIPFFPAYENTMLVWLRFAYDDPSIVARANLIWNAPNEMGLVVDDEGKEVPAGASFDKPAYVTMPEPMGRALAKAVPGGQIPDFPKQSLNFVLPGQNPFAPGFGPIVSTPASWFISQDPGREQNFKKRLERFIGKEGSEIVYQQLVPFGTASGNPADTTLSSSLRQLGIKVGQEGSADFMMRALAIYRDELQRWHDGGMKGPKPKEEDAIKKADDFTDLRLMSAVLSPVATRWRSPYAQYIQEYRDLITQYGFEEGERRFDEKYPEYGTLKLSLTDSPTGMSASMESYDLFKKNTSLWNEVTKIDPRLGQLVVNPYARGEFNSTVYEWSKGRPIAPGSSVKIRDVKSLQDFERQDAVSRGWKEFRAAKAKRDSWLERNGYTSYLEAPQSVKDLWNKWLFDYEQENPDWFTEKEKYSNSAAVRQNIEALTIISSNDKYVRSSPDTDLWVLVQDYLEKRDFIVQELERRDAEGGSDNITAKSNENLLKMWSDYTTKAVNSNTKFADLYDRYLENDDLQRVTVK